MKIAIIGAGISGLTAAYYLRQKHDITVYEYADRMGGHTATVDVDVKGKTYAIDTGFIVYNDWTYPKFIELLNKLNVESQATQMSFSVRCDQSGLEYGGSNLNTLFAQRKNIVNRHFWGMLRDILRFNREAVGDLESGRIAITTTLDEYLRNHAYGDMFINRYLMPMGSAIWSASTTEIRSFPVRFFVQFFKNHGLLSVSNRPQWRVIKGGSRAYLAPLTRDFSDKIVLSARIVSVKRCDHGVVLVMGDGEEVFYDHVIMACHSDQALALLSDASTVERELLASIAYKDNEIVLHTDSRLLPANKRAWSSWNYWLHEQPQSRAVLTYNMNILQGIESEETFCVTLNATDAIDPHKILQRFNYSHPVFSRGSVDAAKRHIEINGVSNLWFAGAYWGNGFHEDGVASGRSVAEAINGLATKVGQVRKYGDA